MNDSWKLDWWARYQGAIASNRNIQFDIQYVFYVEMKTMEKAQLNHIMTVEYL